MAILVMATPALAGVSVIDDAGRQVTLDAPARRIVLTDGIGFLALALIDPDPVARLAGWNRGRMDDSALAVLTAELPGLAAVPDIGDPDRGGPVEGLIALAPDLVVLDPYYNRSPAAIDLLESAGIPVAVLALTPTLRAQEPNAGLLRLGTLIGRQDQARAYADFADARIARIQDRVATLPAEARPPVLIEAHAGHGPCCISVGAGQGIGDFVGFAGGINIGAEVLPGMSGTLPAEYVLRRAPQVYIGTGGQYLASVGGLVVGPGTEAAAARATLIRVAARPGVAETPAATSGRVHGIWHGLAISAFNVVAIEALARWIHPELFADTDPAATMAEIEARFLAAPLPGALWISEQEGE
ncbi:MAG: ABC transporter substrate-binding protein [Paracoccaceae bacterium]